MLLSRYFPARGYAPRLVVANVGLHMAAHETLAEIRAYFQPRVVRLFQGLRAAFPNAHVVWVATLDRFGDPASRPKIEFMNEAARKAARQNDVAFLDAFGLADQVRHLAADGVHLLLEDYLFYRVLRDTIVAWSCAGGAL